MRIATWNINGVKARMGACSKWLEDVKPDIVCLQEIKIVDEEFPAARDRGAGLQCRDLRPEELERRCNPSKNRFDEVTRGLPGDDSDEQSRLIEGVFSTESGVVRVCCIYLPNGNPVETDKFPYKLSWMDRLITFVEGRLALEEPFVLLGDFNIIPAAIDATFPDKWVGDALFRPESAERWRTLLNLGLIDALRAVSDEPNYTFWDFKTFGWDRKDGIRIDHLLLSPQAADRLEDVIVHRKCAAGTSRATTCRSRATFALAERVPDRSATIEALPSAARMRRNAYSVVAALDRRLPDGSANGCDSRPQRCCAEQLRAIAGSRADPAEPVMRLWLEWKRDIARTQGLRTISGCANASMQISLIRENVRWRECSADAH